MTRILAIAAVAFVFGCAGTPAQSESTMTDMTNLEVPSSPNTWVVAPEGYLKTAKADAIAPLYAQEPAVVFDKLVQIVKAAPRTSNIKVDTDALTISYASRVALTVFKDDVDIMVMEAESGGSTLVAYSRSRVGYSDFGVNERRLTALISELNSALGQ